MIESIKTLFSSQGFMPHIHCYLDRPALVWTMFTTNLIIGISYFLISLTLLALIKKIKLPLNFIVICFAAFIGACGLTHFLEVWTLWKPDYWAAAAVSTVTAAASIGTAIYLYRLRHAIFLIAETAKLSEQRRLDLETLTHSLEKREQERTTELERTTDILNNIMQTTLDIVYLKDRQSRMIYCNPRTLELTGKSEAELYGKNDIEFLGPGNGGEEIIKTDERIMSTGKAETAEEWVTWRDGTRRLYLSRKVPHKDPFGNIIGLIGISTDITERKQAEKERQVSEVKLKTVLEHVPVGIGVTDSYGNLEYLNPKGIEIWASKRDVDLNTYAEYQAWDAETGERIESHEWAMARAIIKHETTQPRLFRIKAFDGTEKFILDSASPMFGKNGEFLGGVGTAQEVTSLIQAEQSLRESEARFRQFAEAIPQLGWIAHADGSIYWYNENWYRFTGTTPKQMEGWGWQSVHDPKILPKVLEKWKESIATGEPFDMEFPLKGADGKFKWFLTRVTPIKDQHGNVAQWFGTNTDIHELRIYQEQLKEALIARDEFLSIASHELKTPLTSLKLQAQLSKRTRDRGDPSTYMPERVNKLIDQTNRQVERLTRLVDDMLDVSRIRAGKLSLQKESVALCNLVGEVFERLGPNFKEASTPASYECLKPVQVEGDRLRIEQVLINLLTNAMRYGEKKPIHVRILISEQDSTRAQIIVQDQGMGIAAEAKERIFDRFKREVSENEVSGLGLGLFISKQIVEAHGGKIWVESQGIGQGSSFYVELPHASYLPDGSDSFSESFRKP